MSSSPDWSVIVLAGGDGRRLGGADKSAIDLDGQTTLDRILDSIPSEMPVVVAGPHRPTHRAASFRQESPPGGGPVAGIAAALSDIASPRVMVVATDMPWAGRLLPALIEEFVSSGAGVVIPVDAHGRAQPLFSAWRTRVLRLALAQLGDPRHRSLKDLLEIAEPATWQLDADQSRALADIDTPADLRAARERHDDLE